MAKVNIEDKEYDMDALPAEAQTQVRNVAYCDNRIREIQAEMAMVRTARASYLNSLMKVLPKDS